ncbi:MAG: peptidoglycan DD-metalloendopeptidase family protein [Flavobacteriales bacterium]|nr:peptidoglycan DD-metalloendopeptidase family protein [Flavobacteriales bacterium]
MSVLHACTGEVQNPDCQANGPLDNDLVNIEYGIVTNDFIVVRDEVRRHQSLASILLPYQVPMATIDQLAKASKEVFDVRRIAAGRPFTIFCDKDSAGAARCFIYEVNATEYVVFDLRDTINIYRDSKPMETRFRHIRGQIDASLYVDLRKAGADPTLAIGLSEIYAWTIDFYRIQKGDAFEVLFEENYVEGQPIGLGRILSSTFSQNGRTFSAYYFEHEGEKGYFDAQGNSLRRAFLKAPVKFSRISSGYSKSRLHPILNTLRPHFGTDYAAPTGTPIMAVGDGTVSEAKYSGGNGNYVKIRHNSVYETQYLHMSKFAAGIRPGKRVSQGDIIGYVGSTGLATGPHVCFRFWKNGKQIDHRKEELPSAGPVPDSVRPLFNRRMMELDSLAVVNAVTMPL